MEKLYLAISYHVSTLLQRGTFIADGLPINVFPSLLFPPEVLLPLGIFSTLLPLQGNCSASFYDSVNVSSSLFQQGTVDITVHYAEVNMPNMTLDDAALSLQGLDSGTFVFGSITMSGVSSLVGLSGSIGIQDMTMTGSSQG